MSQLPDAFQGHDLTGWTAYGHYILRGTRYCNTMRIWACDDGLFELDILNEVFTPTRAILSECLLDADALAADYGGWAPAPIGSDPGWRIDWDECPDDVHLRGCWVKNIHSGAFHFESYVGHVDEDGGFILSGGDSSPWEADDFDCWANLPSVSSRPAPPEVKPWICLWQGPQPKHVDNRLVK